MSETGNFKAGDDATVVGKVTGEVGKRAVVINSTEPDGSISLNSYSSIAFGSGAKAGKGCIAIGSGASAGSSSSLATLNIYGDNYGNNLGNTMSETNINQSNSSIGIGVNQGGKIKTEKLAGTINEAQSQNLAEAATEIQSLLEKLSETHPTTTSKEKTIVVGEAVDQIEKNPTLKVKVINALKAGGTEAFKEAVNHPLVNILVATIEGWKTE